MGRGAFSTFCQMLLRDSPVAAAPAAPAANPTELCHLAHPSSSLTSQTLGRNLDMREEKRGRGGGGGRYRLWRGGTWEDLNIAAVVPLPLPLPRVVRIDDINVYYELLRFDRDSDRVALGLDLGAFDRRARRDGGTTGSSRLWWRARLLHL